MKKLLLLLVCFSLIVACIFSGCSSGGNTAKQETDPTATVEITDQAGRTVTIPTPENLKKVFSQSPLGEMMVYSINPEFLAATYTKYTEESLKYLDPVMKDVPYLGVFSAGQVVNKEQILGSNAQVIVYVGPNQLDQATIDAANDLQNQLNMPVVVVSGLFEDMPASYRFLGKLFGEETTAEKLALYCEDVINNVMVKVSQIPDDKRVPVYYAEGNEGLETEPVSSSHAAVLKYANVYNVATVDLVKGSGLSSVSLEQVFNWNPQVIVGVKATCDYIKSNPDWADIDAVKNGLIYEIPAVPFNWIDRPPSINRILGVQWMANLLYPDVYNIDIIKQAKEFYKMFYHIDVTDDQIKSIMTNATSK